MSLSPSEIQYQEEHINDNARPSIISANIICAAIALTATILRLTARRLRHLTLQVDDYLLMIGTFFCIAFLANTFVGLSYGAGRHFTLSKDPVAFVKYVAVAEIVYATGIVPVKMSLIFLYRRLFPNRRLHIALWLVCGVIVSFGIAADTLAIFTCVPVRKAWNPTVPGHCVDHIDSFILVHGIQNLVTDIVLLCLPMPLVWRLQMPTSKKIQVSSVFVLGGFASITSIVRISYLSNLSFVDPSWSDNEGNVWSMVELSIGIASACAPTLGPIVTYLSHGRAGFENGSYNQNLVSNGWSTSKTSTARTKELAQTSWPDHKFGKSENRAGGHNFTRLETLRGDDVESVWAPVVAPAMVDMRAMRSTNHRVGAADDDRRPSNSRRVKTEIMQVPSKPRVI